MNEHNSPRKCIETSVAAQRDRNTHTAGGALQDEINSKRNECDKKLALPYSVKSALKAGEIVRIDVRTEKEYMIEHFAGSLLEASSDSARLVHSYNVSHLSTAPSIMLYS